MGRIWPGSARFGHSSGQGGGATPISGETSSGRRGHCRAAEEMSGGERHRAARSGAGGGEHGAARAG